MLCLLSADSSSCAPFPKRQMCEDTYHNYLLAMHIVALNQIKEKRKNDAPRTTLVERSADVAADEDDTAPLRRIARDGATILCFLIKN